MNTKMATLKEMKADGWKQRTINGVKCLVLAGDQETMICQWRKDVSGFDPFALMEVVKAYGQPDQVHYHSVNVVGCVEYYA